MEAPAAPPHSLHSLGLEVGFRPRRESKLRGKKGLVVHLVLFTYRGRTAKLAASNFPHLKTPLALVLRKQPFL